MVGAETLFDEGVHDRRRDDRYVASAEEYRVHVGIVVQYVLETRFRIGQDTSGVGHVLDRHWELYLCRRVERDDDDVLNVTRSGQGIYHVGDHWFTGDGDQCLGPVPRVLG